MNAHGTIELDLRQVEHGHRAHAWLEWHERLFRHRVVPTDAPSGVLDGYLRGARLADGSLYRVRSAFRRLHRHPDSARAPGQEMFTAVVQLSGSTRLTLADRQVQLDANDITFLHGQEVEKELTLGAEVLLLNAPVKLVLSRQPSATALVGRRLAGHDPVTGLLRNALLGAFDTSPLLTPTQQTSLLLSLIELLGVPQVGMSSPAPHERDERRVELALKQIDLRLFDTGFDAHALALAMCISRRRLDELFVGVLGKPVAPCIWDRRLQRAGDALRDPLQQRRSVTDIALSHGFEDVAHFARAFKKRFGLTALQWRRAAAGDAH